MLPVAVEQVGCVMFPITGGEGDPGGSFITAFAEEGEVHPCAVTVKVYVLGERPVSVVVVPEPFCVVFPGEMLSLQLPEGSPLRAMLPVGVWHVGCVMFPITGADGESGALSTASAEAGDVQPCAVTVKVYVPAASPVTVVVVPDPSRVRLPGEILSVQLSEGSPLRATLPVLFWQVG
jgi:hypothetical protein